MKRLCIFVFYDKEGVVDDYVLYYLREVRTVCSHTIVICNGFLSEVGKCSLLKYSDDVFVRDNFGFDCGAIKDVLFNLYGWEKVLEFDELMIANDTCYGPFVPFVELFERMAEQYYDIFGVVQPTREFRTYRKDLTDFSVYTEEEHIQTYFMNIGKKLLHSNDFYQFWDEIKVFNIFDMSIWEYELSFTQYCKEKSYTVKSICDFSEFTSDRYELNFNISFTAIKDVLISGFPFLKRKHFSMPDFSLDIMQSFSPNDAIDYISEHFNYDVNMIYDNLIRVTPPTFLTQTMYLNYIVRNKYAGNIADNIKFGIVIECSKYKDLVMHYICEENVISVSNCNAVDFVCYITDNNILDIDNRVFSQKNAFEYVLKNSINSDDYIVNTLSLFDTNPRIGILSVKQPYNSNYFQSLGFEYKYGVKYVYSAYWIRSSIIDEQCNINKYESVIKSARYKGYLIGEIINEACVSTRMVDLELILAQQLGMFRDHNYMSYSQMQYYYSLVSSIDPLYENMKIKNVYLYGCGVFGKFAATVLMGLGIPITSFVVSDEIDISLVDISELFNISVMHISDATSNIDSSYIFICVDYKLYDLLYENAKNHGFRNIIDVMYRNKRVQGDNLWKMNNIMR